MKHQIERIQAAFLNPDTAKPEDRHNAWLAEIHPALKMRISKRARRLALRLDHDGRTMHLVVPVRFSVRKAQQFALEHREWIASKLAEAPPPIPFTDGALIPILGEERSVQVIFNPDRKITKVELSPGLLRITTNRDDPGSRIVRHLKNEARATMAGLAQEKAALIGKSVKEVQVRDTKSRWGSCAPDGRICFSWRLVFAPWEAMDYVVAHEVAHLAHMNHSAAFWRQCAALSENYESGKNWIRNNGAELMRYG
ncbi:MAG: M48 family metallopeptidase [Rhodospirillales bacterium]|nr:M48 family metallopeptidase [Rhodospirillales bacterium]MCB9995840.1 M48 family metallopeptidase [Rhodospirillales bacterium]